MKKLTKKDFFDSLKHYLTQANPVFIFFIALAPVLAVTNNLDLTVILGVTLLVVLILTNLTLVFVNDRLSNDMRYLVWFVIIAFYVSISEMILQVSNLTAYESLGIYVPLLSISVFILTFTLFSKKNQDNKVFVLEASTMGIGFMITMVILAIIRSVITTGAVRLFGIQMRIFDVAYSFTLLDSAFGALLFLGIMSGFFRSKVKGVQS